MRRDFHIITTYINTYNAAIHNSNKTIKITQFVTVNGKTYTNALPFNGKFRLVSVYHPFKRVACPF